MNKMLACAALAAASLSLGGCVTAALTGASLLAGDAVSKRMMPDADVLTATALGTHSDNVTILGDVDFEGALLENNKAVWTASVKSDADVRTYKCEYASNTSSANCVPISG